MFRSFIHICILFQFFLNTLVSNGLAQAQVLLLPQPGQRIGLSQPFNLPILKGIKVYPENPLRFDFILDQGDSLFNFHPLEATYGSTGLESRGVSGGENQVRLKQEVTRLIKYFLASLTIPEKDLWVNLSPYEHDRIVPQSFGLTQMGRDLLAEDYILKQVTASLIYPEDLIGKKFWRRIYQEAARRFGTTNIPVNTFNKVWIVPEKAVVYENAKVGTAYVVESKLKVMLEEDYLSLRKHENSPVLSLKKEGEVSKIPISLTHRGVSGFENVNALGSQIVREIVIPQLTKEVNDNKNFAQLRQIYNSLILATWYKKKIRGSILAAVYEDKNKTTGISIDNPQEKYLIYKRYLKAFKMGVYNYIRQDIDPITQEQIPRKYFSGGFVGEPVNQAMLVTTRNPVSLIQSPWQITTYLALSSLHNMDKRGHLGVSVGKDRAMVRQELEQLYLAIHIIDHGGPLDLLRDFDNNLGFILKHMLRSSLREKSKILIDQYSQYARDLRLLDDNVIRMINEESMDQEKLVELRIKLENIFQNLKTLFIEADQLVANANMNSLAEDYENSFPGPISISLEELKNVLNDSQQKCHLLSRRYLDINFPAFLSFLGDSDKQYIDLDQWLRAVQDQFSTKQGDSIPVYIDVGKNILSINENLPLFYLVLERLISNARKEIMLHRAEIKKDQQHVTIVVANNLDGGVVISVLNPGVMMADSNSLFIAKPNQTRGVALPFSYYAITKLMGGKLLVSNVIHKNMVRFFIILPASKNLKTANRAMLTTIKKSGSAQVSKNGGVDLTSTVRSLQIKDSGDAVKFHIDRAMFQQLKNALGLFPVIINIQPLVNLRVFLGLS